MADRSPDDQTELDRRLESLLNSGLEGQNPREATQRSILDALAPSLVPVKRIGSQAALVAQILGLFVAGVLAAGALTGWLGLQLMTRAQIVAMAAVLAAGAILFAAGLAARMVPAAPRMRFPWAPALLGAAFLTCVGLLFPWQRGGASMAEGLPCALVVLGTTLPSAALFWLLARRGAPFVDGAFGGVLGGLAAFMGLTVVQEHCMFPSALHLLVWHGGVAAALIAVGAIGGAGARAVTGRHAK